MATRNNGSKKNDRKKSTKNLKNDRSKAPSINEDTAAFRPLFDSMFDESANMKIDPFICIPFANIRDVSESGLRRLIALFDDSYQHQDGTPSRPRSRFGRTHSG